MKHLLYSFCYFILASCICSCNTYRQNILFKTSAADFPEHIKPAVMEVEANYLIRKNDYLKVQVFTNNGERIIDPDFELQQNANLLRRIEPEYLVQKDGLVNLPVVGTVNLEGYTLYQASRLLEEKYSYFYKGAYVLVSFTNKRVVVLGAPGGQVIPLMNEEMNLIEVLALAGGLDNNAKAGNIRLIRGDINNPQVYVIDLSTVGAMRNYNLKVQPGDIIYIEPVRRVIPEGLRDIMPVFSIVTSLLTLLIVARQF